MRVFLAGVLFGVAATVSVDIRAQRSGERPGWFHTAKEVLNHPEAEQTAYATGAYDMLSFAIETRDSAPDRDWWPLLKRNYKCLNDAASTAGALKAKARSLYTRAIDERAGDESAASVILSNACR